MTELLFWETTLGKTPVSFALDLIPGLALGVQFDGVFMKKSSYPPGWHDIIIYLGPLSLVFTVYGRPA